MSPIQAQPIGAIEAGDPKPGAPREATRLCEPGQPPLSLQVQRPQFTPTASSATGDAIYVHGATFGADLSILYRFDGRSWADEMNEIGLTVWGFDFAGFGRSKRYPQGGDRPAGRMGDAIAQLRRVVAAVRARNGDHPMALVVHSWGASVAARYAGMYPQDVKALVLFAPIVMRTPAAIPAAAARQPSHYPLTLWAQYRRFVEDVPRGQPQVLSEAHFQAWGAAYLATESRCRRESTALRDHPFRPDRRHRCAVDGARALRSEPRHCSDAPGARRVGFAMHRGRCEPPAFCAGQ